ncbi:MAG: carbohydrate ABC transporter permease [bacterium]
MAFINKRNIKKNIVIWSWILVRAVLLIGLSYIILRPILIQLSSSFMTEEQLFDQTVRWVPREITFQNFIYTFNAMDYLNAFYNTLILTLSVSLLQLISCTFIGYGFGRFKSKGISVFFVIVIFSIVVPPQSISVAQYLNFRYFNLFGILGEEGLNLLGTHWPFILTSLTGTGFRNGLFIFIMRQFFKGMPTSLAEAAYVDGAGPVKTFYKVMLPGAAPAILTVFLFSFVWQWNDLFYTSLFLQGDNYLALNLNQAAANFIEWYNEVYGGQDFTGFMYSIINNTAMLMYLAPLLILYAFLQRYFIESIERTGLVG